MGGQCAAAAQPGVLAWGDSHGEHTHPLDTPDEQKLWGILVGQIVHSCACLHRRAQLYYALIANLHCQYTPQPLFVKARLPLDVGHVSLQTPPLLFMPECL